MRTNAYAGVFAREGNDIVIDTVGHVLEMHLSNDIGSPVGIFAGNGKNVTIRTDGLNISTSVNAEYGNSISHGIWNDAGKDQGSTIDITGPVQIYMGGGYGGYGVAVQKLDRWGEKAMRPIPNPKLISMEIFLSGQTQPVHGDRGQQRQCVLQI